ncbi:hypothetical protein DXV65_15870 [Pseudomonas fluorescens]|nr:hypothetical protein DXV65_15870 [Pseudomonas fluorescens]
MKTARVSLMTPPFSSIECKTPRMFLVDQCLALLFLSRLDSVAADENGVFELSQQNAGRWDK